MSVYHITLEQGHKVARPISSEEEYRQIRNSQEQLTILQAVREQGNTKAKKRLAQFNYSGHYPDGKLKGNKLPSGAFPFDCDEREEFERIVPILLEDPERYGLLMLERSARQGGHAVFVREPGKTILENQVRIATLLQTELDTSAHDINRVLFATSASADDLLYLSPKLFMDAYDESAVAEEARILEDKERYGQEDLPEGAHKANKHYRPWESKNLELEIKKEAGAYADDNANTDVTTGAYGERQPQNDALNYLNLPYSEIISTWWELYNDGQEPVTSNRDTLTYELAVNLRHICGFNRELLDKVIPCYDGFPQEQKMKCIDSALRERMCVMPKRLTEVLRLVQQRHTDDEALVSAFDELQEQDNIFYYSQLPKMPMGIQDSINAVGPAMSMPVITAVCPAIGALATGVKLDVHGQLASLNLIAYIAGDFASGKGSIDPVVKAWMSEVKTQDNLYLMQEDEWREKKKAAKNRKDQPAETKYPIRCLTLNNTVANLAERLANTQGKHAFSFTPEADTVAQKWRSSISDFSIMLRQSYDGSAYEREARSVEAVNVHIPSLLWNVTMCGTPDALFRVVRNYTDGFQSRIALSHTPDNTFARLEDKPPVLTLRQKERIQQVAHLLPLMEGELVLPKLEQRGRTWLEKVRLGSMKNDDQVLARQRFRIAVTAQRMTCCLLLCYVVEKLISKHGYAGAEQMLKLHPDLWKEMMLKAQNSKLMEAYDVLADSLLENALFYFRDRIEAAFSCSDYRGSDRKRVGKNDTIFGRLGHQFTFEQAKEQAILIKGHNMTTNSLHQMLKNWKNQGLVNKLPTGEYVKTEEL